MGDGILIDNTEVLLLRLDMGLKTSAPTSWAHTASEVPRPHLSEGEKIKKVSFFPSSGEMSSTARESSSSPAHERSSSTARVEKCSSHVSSSSSVRNVSAKVDKRPEIDVASLLVEDSIDSLLDDNSIDRLLEEAVVDVKTPEYTAPSMPLWENLFVPDNNNRARGRGACTKPIKM